MKKILIAQLLLFTSLCAYSQDLRISQINTNPLMFTGEIDIYFSVPGADQDAFESGDFTVSEKSVGELEITAFEKRPNENNAVDFILLIDNSGSMYDELADGRRRIDRATAALGSFLDQIEAAGDNAAVYTFNSNLNETAPLGTPVADIRRRLSEIERPAEGESYTELYNSLNTAASLFEGSGGRRAVIVLSDGENYPQALHGESPGSMWGTRLANPAEIISTYHENGVSLDGISIADSRDAELESICAGSGGYFYDVRSAEGIAAVYTEIREKISSELLIKVRTPPLQTSIGELTLGWQDKTDSRVLMVPLLFGGRSDTPAAVSLIIIFAAAVCIAVLFIIPFEHPSSSAQIQSLESNRKTVLNSDTTVIGASRDADFTLAGSPGIDAEHAEIVYDDKTDAYTIVSRKAVRVNNRKVRKRRLSPGDVIRIEGSTIIFDRPAEGRN